MDLEITALLCGVDTPILSLLCGPLARAVSWGYCLSKPLNCSFHITVETRVYTQSSIFRSEGFLGQGFCCEGLGSFLFVFLSVWPLAWWQEKFLQSLA